MRIWHALTLWLAACTGGTIQLDGVDQDGDGVGELEDCDDSDPDVFPGADERCNGIDDDCDGRVDEDPVDGVEGWPDVDGDGFGDASGAGTVCELGPGTSQDRTDCDDGDPEVSPGAQEVCNGIDDDCNGVVDDDPVDGSRWYRDGDGDGSGRPESEKLACSQPDNHVAEGGDCDDEDPSVFPGAIERCDGVDSACDGPGWLEGDPDGDGWMTCQEALWIATDDSYTSSPTSTWSAGSADAAELLSDQGVTWSMIRTGSDRISSERLDAHGLVILYGQGTDRVSNREHERLLEWIEQGGRMLVATGWGSEESCAVAAWPALGLGCAQEGDWTGSVEVVSSHPVVDGVREVCVRGADRWEVQAPAELLAQGEWPVLAAVEHGSGRVVALSDEWPMYNERTGDCDIGSGDHARLVSNTWSWLLDWQL